MKQLTNLDVWAELNIIVLELLDAIRQIID